MHSHAKHFMKRIILKIIHHLPELQFSHCVQSALSIMCAHSSGSLSVV